MLLAASIAYCTDGILTPDFADAAAALIVSLIILLSCVPLIFGLKKTFMEIQVLKKSPLYNNDLLGESRGCCGC